MPRDEESEPKSTVVNGQQYASSLESIDPSPQACDPSDAVPDRTVDLGYFGPRPLPSNPTEGFIFSGTAEQAQIPSTTQLPGWRLAVDAVRTGTEFWRFTQTGWAISS